MKQDELNITLDQRSAVPLYEQICQQIRRKIESRQLQPGAPLPTSHDFCEQLQVSYTTAHQAMSTLAKEGYVTRMARRGTVVKEIPRRGVVGIYAFMELLGPEMKYDFYRVITAHLSRQLENHGRVYRMYLGTESLQTPNTAAEDMMRHLMGGTLCGAILINPFPRVGKLVEQSRIARVPVVALSGNNEADYSVRVDYAEAIRSAAAYLKQQGRKRVGLIYNQDSLTLRDPKVMGQVLGECGYDSSPSWIVGGDDTEEGGYEAAGQLPMGELDGLILQDDVMGLGVERRLMEMKVWVPDALAVTILCNRGSRVRARLPFEPIEFDAEKQVQASLQLMQNAISGMRISKPHRKVAPVHGSFRNAARAALAV